MTSKLKRKSCEQGLITKRCVSMHTNYLSFKMALYSSALVMKVVENCFKPKFLP